MDMVFNVIWILWLLSEVLLNRLMRAKKDSSRGHDKGSLLSIWSAITVSIFAGEYLKHTTRFFIIDSDFLIYPGMVLILAGMLTRFRAIRTLGRAFTVNLAFQEDQKLVTHGLYKYIRHPSYSGSLLSFFGFALSLNNWISLAVVFIPVTTSFLYRISVEEKLLKQQPNLRYQEYASKTKRLIPKIY
jgi:protein-S-isoprenylcysteine O-methyltransferase Ste14